MDLDENEVAQLWRDKIALEKDNERLQVRIRKIDEQLQQERSDSSERYSDIKREALRLQTERDQLKRQVTTLERDKAETAREHAGPSSEAGPPPPARGRQGRRAYRDLHAKHAWPRHARY